MTDGLARFQDGAKYLWCKVRGGHRVSNTVLTEDGATRHCLRCNAIQIVHEGRWRWVDG